MGDKLVVLGCKCVLAIDRRTGKELWRQHYRHPSYATIAAARLGRDHALACPDGSVLRASDGQVLSEHVGRFEGECASPILAGDRFFLIARAGFCCVKLPPELTPGVKASLLYSVEPDVLHPKAEIYCVGSPLVHEGLVYAVRGGWGGGSREPILFVIEADGGKVVYRQTLDLHGALFYDPKGSGVACSVTMAGDYLYVVDNRGTFIVLKPGRRFQQVAKNTIEHLDTREMVQEVTNSTPIFEGRRMYYRGLENLYCIE